MQNEIVYKKMKAIFDLLREKLSWEENIVEEYKRFLDQYDVIYFFVWEKDGIECAQYMSSILKNKEVYFIDANVEYHGKELLSGIYCYGIEKMFGTDWHTSVIVISSYKYLNDIWRIIHEERYQTLGKLKHAAICKELAHYISQRERQDENLEELWENNVKQYLTFEEKIFQVLDILEDDISKHILYRIVATRFLFNESNMIDVFMPNINFPDEIREMLSQEEVFLDCGAYPGDVTMDFIKFTENKFDKIYMFELDEKNYNYIKQQEVFDDPRIVLLNQGLGSRDYKTEYIQRGDFHSVITDYQSPYSSNLNLPRDGVETCYIRSLDSLKAQGIIKNRITFIHVNIPHTLSVLQGASNILKAEKPKLAIRVNDSRLSICSVALYLKEIVPEYKLIIRHHSDLLKRTVLYAY